MKIAESGVAQPDPHAGAAIDTLACQRRQHPVAVGILADRTAERPQSAAAPPSLAIATAALAAQPPLTAK